ncbi:MAG: carbamoyl phosphate synthase-like protein [Planctomycetaceae bacterium]|nr:carbamoyl phosphate synthase-like protein [Planctomycetaceae bacterium]
MTNRLFISEFVCGGQWPETGWDSSLAVEGRSMLLALLCDAARIPDLEVVTTWDHRLAQLQHPGVRIIQTNSQAEAAELFEDLVASSEATLLIAPEFDGLLTQRALLVEGIGSRLCGPNPAAIAQCSDKLLLSEILLEAGVPTIQTHEFSLEQTPAAEISFPAVIKPRDGAGSQETYLVLDSAELSRYRRSWGNSCLLSQAIWQPYVSGRAVSVAVLITPEQYRYEALPVCEQILSSDGRFHYQGGILPARGVEAALIQAAAVAACRAVAGLRGFVGVDLIIPEGCPTQPLVVEINPRATTSYLGYTHLCESNLLQRWLNPCENEAPLRWKSGRIQYLPNGEITQVD